MIRATKPEPSHLEDSPESARRAPQVPEVVAWVSLLAIGLGTYAGVATGGTPLFLLLWSVGTAGVALAQAIPARLALVIAPFSMMTLLVILAEFLPMVGVRQVPVLPALLLLIGLGSLVVLVAMRRRGRLWLPGRGALTLIASALVTPVLVITQFIVAEMGSPGRKLAFLLNGDGVFSLLLARRIILDDGGPSRLAESNPVPGAFDLYALFIAPGWSKLQPDMWVRHEFMRVEQALFLCLVGTSFLAGLLVASVIDRRRWLARLAVAAVAGALPFSFFVAGYGIWNGFWNAIVVGPILLGSLWLYLEGRSAPTVASAGQVLAATIAAATWAPLVLIPAALAATLVFTQPRAHLTLRGVRLLAWIVPVCAFVGFFWFVTLARMGEHQGALAWPGALVTNQTASINGVVIALMMCVAGFTVVRDRHEMLGYAAALAAGTLGFSYLVYQRASAGEDWWGYYPAKFAWISITALIVMAARAACRVGQAPSKARTPRSYATWGGVVLACLGMAAITMQLPPGEPRPVSNANPVYEAAPFWHWDAIWPLLSATKRDGLSEFDPQFDTMQKYSDPDLKLIFSNYYQDDVTRESFMNYWLLQQALLYDNADVRAFAYTLNSHDPAAVCGVLAAFGEGPQIITSSRDWADTVKGTCPDQDFTVKLLPKPADDRPAPPPPAA